MAARAPTQSVPAHRSTAALAGRCRFTAHPGCHRLTTRQTKRLVVVLLDLRDDREELRPARGVEQVPARLARDVRTEVVAALSERRRLDRVAVHHAGPVLLRGRIDLDRVV